jgi:hypothetical protein
MADELVDRMAILVAVRRFHGMGVGDSRSWRYDSYVRMQHFVCRLFLFKPPHQPHKLNIKHQLQCIKL